MIKGLDKEVRDLILNPNEDDLAEECMENLLKVCNHVISELNKGEDKIYTKPTMKGDVRILEPSKIIIPENRSDLRCVDNTKSEQFQIQLVKLINSVCEQSVIEKAVECYLSSV